MVWIGVCVLIGGVILFGYGSLTIQNLFEKMQELYTNPIDVAVNTGMTMSPFQTLEAQLFLMQFLQLMGLGMAVVGTIMLAYGLWIRKRE